MCLCKNQGSVIKEEGRTSMSVEVDINTLCHLVSHSNDVMIYLTVSTDSHGHIYDIVITNDSNTTKISMLFFYSIPHSLKPSLTF